MEFDDTVNQLMMFNRAEEKNKTIILEYAPMLRDFLQRQDLYDIDYYSIFDNLQAPTLITLDQLIL
ncbi:accessory Sec system glycosyltransferase Asp1 [Ligilactobacillus salivarius]|uniref:accessory Sec system glycosyltransferase Asp1 n=1 Tax=Ligilactobacillus salivarius TaxID=1624 RepID=UPI0021F088C8|nr:accessory Sec system glycosyltransferase Asp1 [Ligilactobacillus salivarius]